MNNKRVVLLLGTNLGNKKKNLEEAKIQIRHVLGDIGIQSAVYQTKAVGFVGDDFYNQIILIETYENPFSLLEKLKSIEIDMGRTRKTINKSYTSRIIDIDILLYSDWVISSSILQIPHRQILEREFVGEILIGIIPNHFHPVLMQPMKDIFEVGNLFTKIIQE